MTIAHMATFDHGTVEEFLAFWILLAHFRMLVGVLLGKEYDSGTNGSIVPSCAFSGLLFLCVGKHSQKVLRTELLARLGALTPVLEAQVAAEVHSKSFHGSQSAIGTVNVPRCDSVQ